MGKRLLRATILRPLLDAASIEARYEAVGEAYAGLVKREEIRRAFGGLLDLERLLARLSLDSAGPRDLRAMAASLARLPGLKVAFEAMTAPLWRELAGRLDALDDVTARIVQYSCRRAAAYSGRWRCDRSGSGRGAGRVAHHLLDRAGSRLRQLKTASGSGRASARSRCAITRSSAITSRSPRPTGQGAGGLRAQADAGECGAVYHARS